MSFNTPQQESRINDVLFRINQDISREISAKELAKTAAYSEQHFHRVFKKVVGETFNHYVRRTRLERAVKLLAFNRKVSVLDIAHQCGFQSLSGFIKVFNTSFRMTPGRWRTHNKKNSQKHFLTDPVLLEGYKRIVTKALPHPEIIYRPDQRVAYIRHRGYQPDIKETWQKLLSWERRQYGCNEGEQIGLHHSNPAWVPLKDCQYVACIESSLPVVRRGQISSLTIPGGEYAEFNIVGNYGEVVPYLDRILNEWLPSSGYKLGTTPTMARYRKNHFISEDNTFDLTLCLPLSL